MKRDYIVKIILLFYFYHVCSSQPVTISEEVLPLSDNDFDVLDKFGALSGSLFGTVKKYYCKANVGQESESLLYGTKSWTFPAQDVTLKLEYPSNNLKYDPLSNLDYILTELRVIIYFDGDSNRGYITDGGMLQGHISISFVFSNITSLAYQLYLYGVPENTVHPRNNQTIINHLC